MRFQHCFAERAKTLCQCFAVFIIHDITGFQLIQFFAETGQLSAGAVFFGSSCFCRKSSLDLTACKVPDRVFGIGKWLDSCGLTGESDDGIQTGLDLFHLFSDSGSSLSAHP